MTRDDIGATCVATGTDVRSDTAVSTFTDRRRAQLLAGPEPLPSLVPEWLTAARCYSPSLSPDGSAVAFVSDLDGLPALWLSPTHTQTPAEPVRLETGPDHVRGVLWSPDGRWLACLLAPYGGEQTRVLVVRPDGSGPRVLAGGEGHAATVGPWLMDGTGLGVTEAGRTGDPVAYVVDPDTGERTRLAEGPAAQVCAFSPNGRHAVVRVGRRGARELRVVHIESRRTSQLLTSRGRSTGRPGGGVVTSGTTVADARYSIDGARLYVHTDFGRDRPALLALPLTRSGLRKDAYARHAVVAARPDADLDTFALCGGTVAAVWNLDGRTEVELIEPDHDRHRVLDAPAEVVTALTFSHDGSELLVTAEGPAQPPAVWRYPLRDADGPAGLAPERLVPVTPPAWPADELISPTLCRYAAGDGLELSGWLYQPIGHSGPMPTVLWLHGGPEAQERPTFNPLHQALVGAGVAVFAPNVRGSSGQGRRFVNADNGDRRFAAISDVAATVRFLVESGLADPARVGVSGRSYGGYLTLAALVRYPELFRVGVDVCGMADLETFFAYTEPWIADAATIKYGDPSTDGALLRELSPLHGVERLVAPLLVVHGEHDTNVPLVEAEQIVQALRERGAAPGFLLFPDEGHEIHRVANRVTFVREVARWLTGHLLEATEQTA